MKTVTEKIMDELLLKAAESPRKRTNLNLHEEMSEPIHRLCIAALPETVIKPHRHPGKFELVIMLRGRVTVETFRMDCSPAGSYELAAGGPCKVLEMDDTVYHRFIVHEPTVFLEVKKGPYEPAEDMP